MKKDRKWAVALIVILTALLGGCAPKAPDTLKTINIGYATSGSSWQKGILGVADVKGYLDRYMNPRGYEVALHALTGAAPAINEAMVAKDLDVAYYSGMAAMTAKSKGVNNVVVAVQGNTANWQITTLDTAGMVSPTDLVGKTIAYVKGTSAHEYLIKVLEDYQVDVADVELVNMSIPDGVAALATGAVDAVLTNIGQDQNIEGAISIHNEREGGNIRYYSSGVIAVREDYLETDAAGIIALLEVLMNTRDEMIQAPEMYYTIYAEQTELDLDFVRETLGSDAIEDTMVIDPATDYLAKFESVEQFLLDNALIEESVNLETWIDNSYIEAANKNLGQ